jgi:ubiquinone/menaquinone biosynthesis C-methylase UbiE
MEHNMSSEVEVAKHIGSVDTQEYWSDHNVTLHRVYESARESLDYFEWRNDQYPGYIDLMPVAGADGLDVLDFGCGPGHDLVGFAVHSKPRRLVGADISGPSLAEANARLKHHGANVELVLAEPMAERLPFEDNSFDLVHSSGVIHHMPHPNYVLRELYRVLRPSGRANIMVYNRDSIWTHLYVAYQKQLVEGAFAGLSLDQAFAKSTDGPDCPISIAYRPAEFIGRSEAVGFSARFKGAAISLWELSLLPKRFDAMMDQRLPAESRLFLRDLTFDAHGRPLNAGVIAGVDGCYELQKR